MIKNGPFKNFLILRAVGDVAFLPSEILCENQKTSECSYQANMDTLLVVSVEPFSLGDESASVTLRSEHCDVVVFCYPCELKEGDYVPNHLSALDASAQAAYLSDWPDWQKEELGKERLEKIDAYPYSYRGCGRVIDYENGLIEVLGFRIDLGEVPYDGAVEFDCMRLDLAKS